MRIRLRRYFILGCVGRGSGFEGSSLAALKDPELDFQQFKDHTSQKSYGSVSMWVLPNEIVLETYVENPPVARRGDPTFVKIQSLLDLHDF